MKFERLYDNSDNKYLYNGKELQDDLGLDWYDYGARYYDPSLGRWFVPDPKSESEYSWTPFRYAFNNPMLYIDPDGKEEDWFENEETGEVINVLGESEVPEDEGKGWVNIGEDDLFGKENIPSGEKGTITKMNPEESVEFMKEQGYSLETKEAEVYEKIEVQTNPETTRETQLDYKEDPTKVTYIKDNFVRIGNTINEVNKRNVDRYWSTGTTVTETWSNQSFQYGKASKNLGNKTQKKIFGIGIPWEDLSKKISKLFKRK